MRTVGGRVAGVFGRWRKHDANYPVHGQRRDDKQCSIDARVIGRGLGRRQGIEKEDDDQPEQKDADLWIAKQSACLRDPSVKQGEHKDRKQ